MNKEVFCRHVREYFNELDENASRPRLLRFAGAATIPQRIGFVAVIEGFRKGHPTEDTFAITASNQPRNVQAIPDIHRFTDSQVSPDQQTKHYNYTNSLYPLKNESRGFSLVIPHHPDEQGALLDHDSVTLLEDSGAPYEINRFIIPALVHGIDDHIILGLAAVTRHRNRSIWSEEVMRLAEERL